MNVTMPEGRWATAGLAALFGAFAALGQAPWGLWYISLAAFSAIFWLLSQAPTWRRAAWTGWSAGAGYFAVALFWIVEPFLVDVARHGWMAPFALTFMAGGFALFWGLAFGVAHRFGGRTQQTAFGVLLLTGAELLRGVILTGFPWATIGHIWTDHPILQLAALGGATLLSVLTLTVSALPIMLPNRVVGLVGSAIILAGGWGYGAVRLETALDPSGKTARLIQPNATQELKWDPEFAGVFFARQLAMTSEPSDEDLDLIVWPETAVYTLLDRAELAFEAIAGAADGSPVIFGGNDVVGDTYRNSLALMNGDGAVIDTYHKHHLVPFGEYVPLGELMANLGIRGMAARDGGGFGSGPGPRLLEVDGVGRVLPLICYELIFPRHLQTAERPDIIVQITNDAWFGNISGPYQHLAQARLRAVEQGLGLIRSANTGITAAIDPLGRILRQTPLNEAGYLDVAMPSALPPTLYARTGDWPIAMVLAALLAGLIAARIRERD
ncbi:apolipoprotein N-acyltransferase [uncultured Litoreibacter sp.]|uniref:apolipoprotein N-acyltransferase n=1 Tax=uncultured Litoreibacter sp. TaxID=1392394 RepID=UPI00345C23FB